MPVHVEIVEINGFELIMYGRGDIEAWVGGEYYGTASPWVITKPEEQWYSRRAGQRAIKTADRKTAIDYLVSQEKRKEGEHAVGEPDRHRN